MRRVHLELLEEDAVGGDLAERLAVGLAALRGRPAVDEEFRAAAAAELAAASAVDSPVAGNAFKIPLVSATVTTTLRQLAASREEAA